MRRYAVKFSDGETAIIDEPNKKQAQMVAAYVAKQHLLKVTNIKFIKTLNH